jgi:hypothetical protein
MAPTVRDRGHRTVCGVEICAERKRILMRKAYRVPNSHLLRSPRSLQHLTAREKDHAQDCYRTDHAVRRVAFRKSIVCLRPWSGPPCCIVKYVQSDCRGTAARRSFFLTLRIQNSSTTILGLDQWKAGEAD